jgi:hypothetical protein
MSNIIQYLNKSKTIDAKCKELTGKVIADYNSGTIKTETEFLYRLKQAIQDFYASIGKPSYKFIPPRSTPISADYNGMIGNAYNDISFIISECINLSDVIKASFVDTEINRSMANNELRYINKKLDDIKNRINTNNDTDGLFTFAESFINTDSMQNSNSDGAAYIDTSDGVLMLGVNSLQEYSKQCDVEILKGSNGFPGDTHMIDILNNNIHYTGEDNLHLNLKEIVDENIDTWFEYELFNVEDLVYEKCNGFGFNYQEGIEWVTDDHELKLILKVILPGAPVCNWLSLTPFLSEQRGVKSCFITKCTVSDGANQMQEITKSKMFDDNTVIIFQPQPVNTIIIEFAQPSSYEVNIGHTYFTKIYTMNTTVYEDLPDNTYTRTDGVMPSVELIGMKYDPSTKDCVQPNTVNANNSFVTDAYIKQQLFSIPADTNKVKANAEIVKAYRYSIGIKNISISHYDFSYYSEYVSKTFITNDIITSITLEADEMIPSEFNDLVTSSSNYQYMTAEQKAASINKWINYYIKVGNDNTWYPIYPKHRSFMGYCTYNINNSGVNRYINNFTSQTGIGMIPLLDDANTVQLKIVLQKPENDTYRSPLVYKYKLNIITGGENY